ncbi:hypothetical protein V2A60_003941 [Cordyceps javanica]
MASSVQPFPSIKAVRSFVIDSLGSGGDYHNVECGHWLIDSDISTPFLVEIEADDGTIGLATGFGGPPACWLLHQHFERFLIGSDPRNSNLLFEQMYRASMFYGRKGLPNAVISVIDLALWDLVGKLRNEPVYRLIGGAMKERITFYCTGPEPTAAQKMGFWGAKVPLPFCPEEGHGGLRKNVEFLRKHREAVGPDFPLMVDCYMSLNVSYTIDLVKACQDLDINWWEECLSPDDTDGFEQIKRAHPAVKFTTGEHEFSRYGFRKLIERRNLDIIQPDVMWLGGMTELLKVAAMAAAYDIPVVPHASGPYSYHFVISQPNTPFQEYLANSPDGKSVLPVFGGLFMDEPIPMKGYLTSADLDKPGFAGVLRQEDPESGLLAHEVGDIRYQETASKSVAAAVHHSRNNRLDICVSNAGICTFADFLTLSPDLFEVTARTNLDGAFYITQAAARQMALHQSPSGGSIIGMSSISALVGGGLQTHYTPTKAGVTSLMQSTAVALGKFGIRCNALLPGTIRTQLNEGDLSDDAKRAYIEGRIPLGRTGVPDDMAGPAVFLACDELSGYVTGAQLLVDGGLFVNLQ